GRRVRYPRRQECRRAVRRRSRHPGMSRSPHRSSGADDPHDARPGRRASAGLFAARGASSRCKHISCVDAHEHEANNMRIAVLGGGHGAYAAAADLSEKGHEVRLWRRDAEAFAPVLTSGAIRLIDAEGSRTVPIAKTTTDIGIAVRGAELILIPSPASAQPDISRAIAPHLE